MLCVSPTLVPRGDTPGRPLLALDANAQHGVHPLDRAGQAASGWGRSQPSMHTFSAACSGGPPLGLQYRVLRAHVQLPRRRVLHHPRATPLPHAHPSVRGESLAGWRCWVAVRCSLLRDNRDSLGGTWPHAVTGIARSPAREVEECASARPAARRCHHHLVLARGWTPAHALQLVHRDGVAEACVGARSLP